jgi:hypothetical protein
MPCVLIHCDVTPMTNCHVALGAEVCCCNAAMWHVNAEVDLSGPATWHVGGTHLSGQYSGGTHLAEVDQ